jgi:hypothetical protein
VECISSLQHQTWYQDKRITPHTYAIPNPIDDYISDEKLLYNTMNEIAPVYEELENLLLNVPEPNKLGILEIIVSQAIAQTILLFS